MTTNTSNTRETRDGQPSVGLLLVGHGSRAPQGVDEFLATARCVAERAKPSVVEPCFLEFAEPSIARGFERLAERGARRVVVAPVMLFAARHIREDIPREVAAAAARHPQVAVEQAGHLGCHPAIIELSKQRYDEALAKGTAIAVEETVLVTVGRGSRDPQATDEMRRFVRMRREGSAVADAQVSFLAMAEPRLEDVLREVAAAGPICVVVQPHLLFAGELTARVRGIVEQFSRDFPRIQWRMTEHLGPSELVIRAVLDRAGSTTPV